MQIVTRFSSVLLACSVSFTSLAADFTEADALFERRGEGVEVSDQALAAYEGMLDSLSGPELIYAVSQMGRLFAYRGDMLIPKSDKATRKSIFKKCFDNVLPRIDPENVGENPQYYYWRATCVAFWGEAASTLERAIKVPLLKSLLKDGMEGDTRYYGGGILRVYGGVYSNPAARAVGLYDPEQALAKIDQALEGEAYPGDVNSGLEYYANYRYKVDTLEELDRKAEALELATSAIEEIEFLMAENQLPEGLGPETAHDLKILKEQQARLQQ